MGVDFQPIINLGTLIHLVALLVAVMGLYWKVGERVSAAIREVSDRLARLETKVDALWRAFLRNNKEES